jgi:intracellular septation protein A
MSNPSQDIRKSNVIVIMVASIKVGMTWDSMDLLTMLGIISLYSCLMFGNITLSNCQRISFLNQMFLGVGKVK